MTPALFRPGTSDRAIWHNVVELGEYKFPQMTERDCCVDIGANTGAAAYAMLQKGAGKVIAFEPDPDNFLLFRKQLKHEIRDGRVECYPLAVVGGSGFSWRTFSGVVKKDGEINYGGAYMFNKDGTDPFGYGEYIVNNPVKVPCIGFDEIEFPEGMSRKLTKLDAEGSEWSILMDSLGVGEFERLVGEYHPHSGYGPEMFGEVLRGFRFVLVPHKDSELGLFWAERIIG